MPPWAPLSAHLTETQSPWYKVTTPSEVALNRDRASPNINVKLMMIAVVEKQAYSTTWRRLHQRRQKFARPCSRSAPGNHEERSCGEAKVTSCSCALRVDAG